MKQCPVCQRTYSDETLNFCLEDGTRLINVSYNSSEAETIYISNPENRVSLQTETPSIAVLPFANMSNDADNEYFCDGLAEELLNALAKIEELKVAARTSAFSFKNKNISVGEIGRALNVKTILEGSVRKSGNRVRFTVQLVNASDGFHLWSEKYDREIKDIFDVEDEITLAVVDALKVKLLGEQKSAVLKRYTDNTEAYELYLKARYFFNKQTPESLQKAIEFFEEAIAKEPNYAPAYAGISVCLGFSWYFGFLPNETVSNWKAITEAALEIDDQSAEAHLSLAHFSFLYEWDWTKAEREYKRATELMPNNGEVRCFYGIFLAACEKFDEAIAETVRAVELDPLSLIVNLYAGFTYLFVSRIEEATKRAHWMNELEPGFFGTHWLIGGVHQKTGEKERAVEAFKKAFELSDNIKIQSYLGYAYGVSGNREAALEILNQLLELREKQYVAEINIARVYGGLGDKDKAFEWLEKAVEERNGELVFLGLDAKASEKEVWGKIFLHDKRFQDLMNRVGLNF